MLTVVGPKARLTRDRVGALTSKGSKVVWASLRIIACVGLWGVVVAVVGSEAVSESFITKKRQK